MKTYTHHPPAILVSLAFLLAATLPLAAQLTPPNDPANLAGERVSPPDLADTLPINHGAPALQQLLRKLRTRASFMLIVAHPDDEDGGLLTYLSRGQGARVAMLTLTRGEGGQNLMSADFEDALGLIRTQELLAADRYMGVDQFFGTEVDFGFSKTKEEAFAKWTHERVLYDAVRAVRLYRPLVIASVFIGAPSDGHGQHQVSGEIAQEVFKAAGDPKVFPDQIAAGLQPWQPLKVYARIPFARIDAQGMFDYATNQYTPALFTNYVTGKVTTTIPKANVVVPEGTPDPLLGNLSYVQFARQGLALQKSQIGHGVRLASPGRFDVSYHRYGSKLNQPDGDDSDLETSFFDSVDTSLPGMASLISGEDAEKRPPSGLSANVLRAFLEKIDAQIADAQKKFDPNNPAQIAPQLREALHNLDGAIQELQDKSLNYFSEAETFNLLHELRIKRVQLNNALILAHDITLTASLADPAPGEPLLTTQQHLSVATKLTNGGADEVILGGIGLQIGWDPKTVSYFPPEMSHLPLAPASARADRVSVSFTNLKPTRPYFSRLNIEQPFYNIANPELRNASATPAPLTALATLDDQGTRLELAAVVADPKAIAIAQPAVAVPPVSIALSRHAQILPSDKDTITVAMTEHPPQEIASLTLGAPPDWKPEYDTNRHPVHNDGNFYLSFAVPSSHRVPVTLRGNVTLQDGTSYSEGYRAVGYPGLTYANYYTPATTHIVPVDVHTAPNLNVAYLPGTGDDVPSALGDLGVQPHLITIADLTPEGLKPYDAVIFGVRAYETHADLAAANPALNSYAANGGVVIAQYNTGRLPEGTGPYPLNLGDGEKVVEEDAPVRLVAPTDPLLNWPNKITTADFDSWVEERGHGFMGTWDSHYTVLLETHDPGQQPQRGGLLVARTGKGAWIYLGLALYRQLPEGVPGAYRLLANLISVAKNPGLEK